MNCFSRSKIRETAFLFDKQGKIFGTLLPDRQRAFRQWYRIVIGATACRPAPRTQSNWKAKKVLEALSPSIFRQKSRHIFRKRDRQHPTPQKSSESTPPTTGTMCYRHGREEEITEDNSQEEQHENHSDCKWPDGERGPAG